MSIHQALIFAAGEAKRMRPLTDHMPKPLLQVQGQALLTQIINHLLAENITRIVINGYYQIDHLRDFIADISQRHSNCEFILSEEKELLETGGGAVKAMQYLNQSQSLYMINGDAYWVNPAGKRSLNMLQKKWYDLDDDNALLLLIQPVSQMPVTSAIGDYDIEADCHLMRNIDKFGQTMFTGIRICHPKLLRGYPEDRFSFLQMMDDAQQAKNLYALVHEGQWFNINTPDDLNDLNDYLREAEAS